MNDDKIKVDLTGLNGKEIWEALYNKELNCKKNILEYIEITRVLKSDNIPSEQIELTYNYIYESIENLKSNIKVNTMMFLKNQLKSQLGKFVKEKDPQKTNYFLEFFKEAYPSDARRKDFTWVLMDINKIADEQIWTTLTYINAWCLKSENYLTSNQKEDILKMVQLLISRNNIKFINNLKSLEKLLNTLDIKIINLRDGFKLKNNH